MATLPKRKPSVRQEILLETASAEAVLAVLRPAYPEVEFIPHPTMNGFYAVGSRLDIIQVKNDVEYLDRE